MPPVLGPVSPSPMRLWSCAGTSGATCLPSLRQRKLISSPSRNSSMTICCSAAPSSAPVNRPCAASTAVLREGQMMTPLPGGQAVGLDDDRRMKEVDGFFDFGGAGADGVVGRGNVVALHEALGEALAGFEHAASRVGPKTRRPRCWSASTMPSERAAPGRRW